MNLFVTEARTQVQPCAGSLREVYITELARRGCSSSIEAYLADRFPLYYRTAARIAETLEAGFVLSAIREALARLPTADSFKESHFGEVASCLFAEEVLGLRRIYSKLTLLTAENANAYKMDLLLYEPGTTPPVLVLGEVKISTKSGATPGEKGHDTTLYPNLFNSLREYSDRDLSFDLAAARDNLPTVPEADRDRIRQALLPYSERDTRFAAFLVIDVRTWNEPDAQVLQTRESNKEFTADVICFQELGGVISGVFTSLERLRDLCTPE